MLCLARAAATVLLRQNLVPSDEACMEQSEACRPQLHGDGAACAVPIDTGVMKRAPTDRAAQDGRCLRVLLFDHVAALSGGEIALLNLVKHLDRRFVEPVVLLGEEGPLADKLRPFAQVHVMPIRGDVVRARKDTLNAASFLKVGTLWSIAKYIRDLAQFLLRHNIDIVHSNSLKADLLAGFACQFTGTPLIWHVRDRIAEDYLPSGVTKVFRTLSRILPTYLIANSQATADTLHWRSRKAYLMKRMSVIHDGTDLETFSGGGGVRTSAAPVIGIVGRISPWKGQDVFLRAAHRVRKTHPKARFRIIGAALFGEAEFETSLRRLCAELQLNDAVEFTGFNDNVAQAIAEIDILVHASTYPEPFGQVIIEGMASSKPVIATSAGGVLEIVEHGRTGLLVEMGDSEQMATAIAEMLSNPAGARAMGLLGRERVEQHFSIQKTADEVLAVYRQMAS